MMNVFSERNIFKAAPTFVIMALGLICALWSNYYEAMDVLTWVMSASLIWYVIIGWTVLPFGGVRVRGGLVFILITFMFHYTFKGVLACKMSLAAIKKLNDNGIKCTVLTKGILPIELADFSIDNEYGITLVSMTEAFRKRMEPHSAKYRDRLAALQALHDRGCRTWVSIEPYPTPNLVQQKLEKILDAVTFTDRIIFGRTNYSKEVTAYPQQKDFYNQCALQVI